MPETKKKGMITACLTVITSLALVVGVCLASAQEQRVRARVGIQVASGGNEAIIKSGDIVRKGDLLRVYIQPEDRMYVYVIHSDTQTATLLNPQPEPIQGAAVVLPSEKEYYQVDGLSDAETFTVICSPSVLKELAIFDAAGKVPSQDWEPVARSLKAKGKISLTQQAEKPIAIGGNVRGLPAGETLPLFSGNGVVVKQYALVVEK